MTSHRRLGGALGGVLTCSGKGFDQPEIHELNAPFFSRFAGIVARKRARTALGAQSNHPQPLAFDTRLSKFGIATVGLVTNAPALRRGFINAGHALSLSEGQHINTTELIAKIIGQESTFADGIRRVFQKIQGSSSLLILTEDGRIIAARDKFGRGSLLLGTRDDAVAVVCESCAIQKQGFTIERFLGPGEAVVIHPDLHIEQLCSPLDEMKFCVFNLTYFSSRPTYHATLEGERILTDNARKSAGRLLGKLLRKYLDKQARSDPDYNPAKYMIVPVPGTAIPIAQGTKEECPEIELGEALIKESEYGQSYTPGTQDVRSLIAHKKLYLIPELVKGRILILIEDSIVRGTQLGDLVAFLLENKAAGVIVIPSFPMIFYRCPYFESTRVTANLAVRKAMRELGLDEEAIPRITDPRTQEHQMVRAQIAKSIGAITVIYAASWQYIQAIAFPAHQACRGCWPGPIREPTDF